MDAMIYGELENEIHELNILIKASESWAPAYRKDAKTHAKLIRNESQYQIAIRKMFGEHAKNIEAFVDWNAYTQAVKKAADAAKANADRVDAAFKVETIVDGDFFDGIDSDFLNISLKPVTLATAIGAQAGEKIYKIPLGIDSTNEAIQKLALNRVAWLVGKRLTKDGDIIDNPNAKYRISDYVRRRIANQVKQSIGLGESKSDLIDRLKDIVADGTRAEKIAQTESVNAYGAGLHEFGRQSGATGKESQDVGAVDECKDHADLGIVPLDYLYGGLYLYPAYHAGCRCGSRLVYANEYEGK